MRHDGPKELFGELSAEVCYDVKVEPDLLPLTGEQFDIKLPRLRQMFGQMPKSP